MNCLCNLFNDDGNLWLIIIALLIWGCNGCNNGCGYGRNNGCGCN